MNLVVIAHSARALVTAATYAGRRVHAVDCYADSDTVALARSVRRTPASALGFQARPLYDNVKSLIAQQAAELSIVLGSGFEGEPGLLSGLAQLAPCLGNSADTLYHCKAPTVFFPLLRELSIRCPEVICGGYPGTGAWLVKAIGAMGGQHIRRFVSDHGYDARTHYLQRYIPGRSLSAVFIADGQRHKVLGFSEHIPPRSDLESAFAFFGAISLVRPDAQMVGYIHACLDKLVAALGLIGLCGIDFLVDHNGGAWILEINPRPPATFELHCPDRPCFEWHLQALQGQLACADRVDSEQRRVRGMLNLYAARDIRISADMTWPSWCANRPSQGCMIQRQAPICTVYASGKTSTAVYHSLYRRQKIIMDRL